MQFPIFYSITFSELDSMMIVFYVRQPALAISLASLLELVLPFLVNPVFGLELLAD